MSIEIEDQAPVPPRSDLIAAVVWMVFGTAVAVGAWRMDRLEKLNINPYEIPGLVPFMLGVIILLLGGVLAVRALGQGALISRPLDRASTDPALARHMAWVFGLMLVYALVLVGSGFLPFWLATLLFVMVFIGVLDRQRQHALGRSPAQQWGRALVYAAVWSAVVSLSFEHIFLVRLP
ncbi:MAG: tripartite tricarboxylate transporter TctB family protein [Burkholderiaceae bacterium]